MFSFHSYITHFPRKHLPSKACQMSQKWNVFPDLSFSYKESSLYRVQQHMHWTHKRTGIYIFFTTNVMTLITRNFSLGAERRESAVGLFYCFNTLILFKQDGPSFLYLVGHIFPGPHGGYQQCLLPHKQ